MKRIYLFDEDSRASTYGIGTYLRQVIELLVKMSDLSLNLGSSLLEKITDIVNLLFQIQFSLLVLVQKDTMYMFGIYYYHI